MGVSSKINNLDSPLHKEDTVELSIVIPCYNEEAVIPISIPPLLELCGEMKLLYEIILVNNGSTDSTDKTIDLFISHGYPIQRVDVSFNQGYGWGIICGLKKARGRYIGYMCSDGQVLAEDVIRTYLAIKGTARGTLSKVKRIRRDDGLLRWFVSLVYNQLFSILFGRITGDVNATPKIFHKEDIQLLKPTSKDSFIDPELMIKAKTLRFNIIEVPVVFHKRKGGSSKIRVLYTSLEFIKNMLWFRFSNDFKGWLNQTKIEQAIPKNINLP